MNDVISAISTVGFPIVMCLILLWINDKQDKRHNEQIEKMNEIVNNNTVALTKLTEKLDGDIKHE